MVGAKLSGAKPSHPLAVGWDKIRGTRLRVGEHWPTVIAWKAPIVGRHSLRDLVPPYLLEINHLVVDF